MQNALKQLLAWWNQPVLPRKRKQHPSPKSLLVNRLHLGLSSELLSFYSLEVQRRQLCFWFNWNTLYILSLFIMLCQFERAAILRS